MLFLEGGKAGVQVKAGEFLTFLFVCPDLLFQRRVIHKPTGMDVLQEGCNLLPVGIHPILVGLKHTSITCLYNNIYFQVIRREYDEEAPLSSPAFRPGSSRSAPSTPEDKSPGSTSYEPVIVSGLYEVATNGEHGTGKNPAG